MKIAVLGLGEAGSHLASDLADGGAEVRAFDPGPVSTPDGVERVTKAAHVVAGVDMVLAATAPLQAPAALAQVIREIPSGALYADISTGSPRLKRGLALTADRSGVDFAGVAILSIIHGNGLHSPSLVSGSGAERYVEIMSPYGAVVEAVGNDPGTAASRKLLRGIMIRGIGALGAEAASAGHAADDLEWLWNNISGELARADEDWLSTLVKNFGIYSATRRGEMESTPLYLEDVGIDPIMTRATVEKVRQVQQQGLPDIP